MNQNRTPVGPPSHHFRICCKSERSVKKLFSSVHYEHCTSHYSDFSRLENMEVLNFHHVGIACRDMEKAAQFVRSTHTIVGDSGCVFDERQNIHVQLLRDRSGLAIELINGPVVADLIQRDITYYHICYEVADLNAAVQNLLTQGCIKALGPIKATLFDDREVAFLMSPLGLIELLEK